MNFVIRQATLEDLDSVSMLWEKLALDQLSKDNYYKGDLHIDDSKSQFKDSLSNPNCCILIACKENIIVGFIEIWLYNKDFYFFIDDYAYILHAFIEPSVRNYKLASKLFKEAEKWAISKGQKYLAADVFQHNSKVMDFLTYFGVKPYRTRLVKELPSK